MRDDDVLSILQSFHEPVMVRAHVLYLDHARSELSKTIFDVLLELSHVAQESTPCKIRQSNPSRWRAALETSQYRSHACGPFLETAMLGEVCFRGRERHRLSMTGGGGPHLRIESRIRNGNICTSFHSLSSLPSPSNIQK
ncbi:hypothetical protein FOMPIDRAFT_118931 [Fomitopsis schrenkii]|uniref:Uncharacterized protein n=1 Tax=Fomitopsis schrenkii TaxID=2126942 RepID=S8G7I8_FOMSC|nr:hypothetical protein FOMPIDRAFT_118931 [Fomitopsis schrenkii]